MNNLLESSAAPSIGVHPGILVPATLPPFDRYVMGGDGEGFRLFQRANEPVYASTRQRLEEAGAEMIYLRGEDREGCFDYVERHLAHLMEEGDLPSGHLAEWVYRLACRAMDSLLADPDNTECYKRVESLVDAITQGALQDPAGQWRMLECAPLKHKTNSHSINVAVLLASFARNVLRVSDRNVLKEVTLGGALHDLGKTRVPAAILDKPAELTRQEFAEVKKHPRHGLEIAKPYLHKANIARHIIAQHHENACGNGYPDGRTGESIDLFARVARVADVFDALTSNRPYSGAIDTYTALNQMVAEMRPQFDVTILRKFIRFLSDDWGPETPPAVISASAADGGAAPFSDTDGDCLPAILIGPPLRTGQDEEPAPEREQEPAEEPAPEPVLAEEPAEQTSRSEEPTVILVKRHLEPVAEAPPPAVKARELDPVEPLPDARTRMEAIQDLCDWQGETSALLSGIMRALNTAVVNLPPRGAEMAQGAQPGAPTADAAPPPAPSADAARKLFPLVWEIDEWRRTFAAGADSTPASSRMRAESMACLNALRESVVEALRGYDVYLIERADKYDPALHSVAGRIPGTGATTAAGHVQRVGFMQRLDDSYEVLEPALVMLMVGQRKAG